MPKKSNNSYRYRSSKTGRFTTKKQANKSPDIHEHERVHKRKK